MSTTHTAIPTGRKGGYLARPAAVSFARLDEEESMTMTYAEQLRRPEWQKVRLQVLNAASWKCESCADEESTLHVHHKSYIKGRKAWDYELRNFEALCEHCHKESHEQKERVNQVLANIPSSMWGGAADTLVFWALPVLPEGTPKPVDPHAEALWELTDRCRERLSIQQMYELIEHVKALPRPKVRGGFIKD